MITFVANLISLKSNNKCQNLIILSIIRSVCIYWGIKHEVVAEQDPRVWTRVRSLVLTVDLGLSLVQKQDYSIKHTVYYISCCP